MPNQGNRLELLEKRKVTIDSIKRLMELLNQGPVLDCFTEADWELTQDRIKNAQDFIEFKKEYSVRFKAKKQHG